MPSEHTIAASCHHLDAADGVECGADVEITLTVSGRYCPATRIDPAGYPDVEYTSHSAECGHALSERDERRAVERAYDDMQRARDDAGLARMVEDY